VYEELAEEIVDEEKYVGYRGGTRAIARLREIGAPASSAMALSVFLSLVMYWSMMSTP
jgi:hypothetical protein